MSPGPRGALWVLAGALLCPALPGAAGAEPTTQPVAKRVLAELRSAGRARSQLLAERQAWAARKARLELLKSTIVREAARQRAAAAEARKAQAALQTRRARQKARKERLVSVEAMVDSLCERLERALAGLARRSLPGLVPPDRASAITDLQRRLAAGIERLDEAARRARRPAVEVVNGTLAGRTVAVKLLRLGGVAAWWLSLDGNLAGSAGVREGQVVLQPTADPRDTEAIRRAFDIAEGRGTPDWVILPLRPKASED